MTEPHCHNTIYTTSLQLAVEFRYPVADILLLISVSADVQYTLIDSDRSVQCIVTSFTRLRCSNVFTQLCTFIVFISYIKL